MAGLPYGVTSLLSGKSTSFLRRAARYELQALSDYEVEEALVRTMKDGGKTFEPDALEAAVKAIKGFPFMLQLVGYRVWRMAESSSVIDISSVDAAANIVRKELEQRIYDAVWFELSEADKSFLQAMTEDSEITRQADLPSRLNKPSGHVSKYKKRMLQQGVIRERSRGLLELCLPDSKSILTNASPKKEALRSLCPTTSQLELILLRAFDHRVQDEAAREGESRPTNTRPTASSAVGSGIFCRDFAAICEDCSKDYWINIHFRKGGW